MRTRRPNRGLIAVRRNEALTVCLCETFLSSKQIGPHRREPSPVTSDGLFIWPLPTHSCTSCSDGGFREV